MISSSRIIAIVYRSVHVRGGSLLCHSSRAFRSPCRAFSCTGYRVASCRDHRLFFSTSRPASSSHAKAHVVRELSKNQVVWRVRKLRRVLSRQTRKKFNQFEQKPRAVRTVVYTKVVRAVDFNYISSKYNKAVTTLLLTRFSSTLIVCQRTSFNFIFFFFFHFSDSWTCSATDVKSVLYRRAAPSRKKNIMANYTGSFADNCRSAKAQCARGKW